jgi:hypothetical protein
MTRRCFAAGLALLLALPFMAGCGVRQGKVSGQVLFNGKPLPGGRLTFRPTDPKQNSVSAVIDPDGRYEATLPGGEVTICVDNRELDPPPRGSGQHPMPPGVKLPEPDRKADAPAAHGGPAAPRMPGTYVPIPEKFYDADTSGLRYTVQKEEDKYDIELK